MTTVVFKLDVLSSNRKIFSRQARFAGSDSKQNHTLLDLCLALCYIPPSQSVGKIEKVGRGLVGSMREKEIPLVTRPPFLSSPLTKDLDQATIVLRWLKTVSSTFQDLFECLMGHYNHSIPVDAKIMVSTNCPIIGEQVAVNFVAQ